jgi:hypothetical protein
MKKISTRSLIIIYLLFSATSYIQAQNEIDYEAEGGLIQFNIFDFEGSEKYDIIFPLSEQIQNLSIQIKSYISSGELSIEIFDPTAEKQGNFSVQGSLNSTKSFKKNEILRSTELNTTKMRIEKNPWIFEKETFKIMGMGDNVAQASISREFKIPMKGNWIIKIICKNAKGLFTIESNYKLFNRILPTKFITGTVYDLKNRPLRGVTIMIKGTSMATISDNEGNFTIPLHDNVETLVFHYKGMISKEVTIGDQAKLSVILEPQKQ